MRPAAVRLGGVLLAAAFLASWPGACRDKKQPCPAQVTINGYSWFVDVAATEDQREVGLAGRTTLPATAGMLFVFPAPEPQTFWMRGCLMDLDIAFIGEDMRVVKTCTMRAEPDLAGRELYHCEEPAQYALEVAAGGLRRAGVKPGDVVTFSGDIPQPVEQKRRP